MLIELDFFVTFSACLCLVTISYITILNHSTTTLTVNYKFYVIALVIPHNSHNNVVSSGRFTCV